MNIFKLERILNHQQHLYYNVPYGPDDITNPGWAAHYGTQVYSEISAEKEALEKRYEELQSKLRTMWDIPTQVELGEKFPFTGFVEIDGTIHKCKSCEHEDLVRSLVYDNPEYFKRYRNVPATFYDRKPQGMLQEEYFLMKYLGFVKISSFEKAPTKKILFRYENLTWKQSDIIYPQ